MFMPGSVPGAMPPSMDMRGIEMLHPSMPQPPMPQGPMGGLGGMLGGLLPQMAPPGMFGLMSPGNLFDYGAMRGLAPIRPPQPIPTPPVQRMPRPQAGGLGLPLPMGNGMGQATMNPFAMPGVMPMGQPMTAGMSSMSAVRPGTAPRMPMQQDLMDVQNLSAFPARY